MGIPVISEVFDGIRWIIDFFFHKAPRPLQIMMFLLMLLLFSNAIVGMLHLVGVHCNQDKQPVKTSFFDVATNLWIFYDTTIKAKFDQPTISYSEAHPYIKYSFGALGGTNCVFILTNKTGEIQYCTEQNDTTCKYYYREQPEGVGIINEGCVYCNYSDLGWIYDATVPIVHKSHIGDICTADAYPKTNKSTSLWTSIFNCNIDCKIPVHYKFSFDTGQYECVDLDYCGVNKTKSTEYEFNEKLKQSGAELIYTDSETISSTKVVGLICNADFNPRVALLGVDIFDYQIWLLLIIIAAMLYGLTILGQQSHLK